MSYMLTHMHVLTQGLTVTGPEDVENAGRLGSCDQLEPRGGARSCPLKRLILGEVCETGEQTYVWLMFSVGDCLN